ncbi:FAD-dependent monooxygenase [Streptomyces gamaensis]|uniref:FAD-dependent monooxygenase n=1 Tax=Streptomyces gamaensis TaxID=1763542 RepID=A0ABW0Z2W1_9ACTN
MNTFQDVRDAVVIGAGPTGLALAIALRRYGLDTTVVEKAPSTKREPRASVIWQRALEALRDLGCADAMTGRGLPLTTAEFHVRGHLAGIQDMRMPHTAFPGPLSIEQDTVEGVLHERLRRLGPDVRWSTEAVAVRRADHGAQIDLHGPDGPPRTVNCRWVVGCEGSRSLLRTTLGIPFEGEQRTNLQCLQLNATADWDHPQHPPITRIFINHGVTLITNPVPGGAIRFFAFCPDTTPGTEDPPTTPPTTEDMTAVVARATGIDHIRLRPTEPHWANRSRFQDRLAATLRQGPALLVGDSAHLWAPIGGRGLNTGLLGAHNLGWKLAAVHHGWCDEELLDTYSTEQRRLAQEVMRHMRRNILELPPDRPTLTAIGLLLPHVLRSATLSRRGSLLLSDFARNHRTSTLSTTGTGGDRTGPRPGDRVPDLAVTSTTGPAHLHDLLSYQRWSLLLVGGTRQHAAAAQELLDQYAVPVALFRIRPRTDTRARHRTLPDRTLLLVRPDGYLGLRTRTDDLPGLEAYAQRWFRRRTR